MSKSKKHLVLLAKKALRIKRYKIVLFGSIIFSWIVVSFSIYNNLIVRQPSRGMVLGTATSRQAQVLISPVAEISPTLTPTLTPTAVPTPTPTLKPIKKRVRVASPTPTSSTGQNPSPSKYTAEKIGDVTWKVKNVENDSSMASPQDIVNALNSYRGAHGKGNLSVDSYLSSFAQERANLFSGSGGLDSHAGFQGFMNNGGFDKAGFNSLGENSAFLSGPMNGEKIIQNIFGADPSHDGNQLNDWTHVGVGVSGNAVNVNFGKNKK